MFLFTLLLYFDTITDKILKCLVFAFTLIKRVYITAFHSFYNSLTDYLTEY